MIEEIKFIQIGKHYFCRKCLTEVYFYEFSWDHWCKCKDKESTHNPELVNDWVELKTYIKKNELEEK